MKIAWIQVLVILIVLAIISVRHASSSENDSNLTRHSFSKESLTSPSNILLRFEENSSPGNLEYVAVPSLLKPGPFPNQNYDSKHRPLSHRQEDIHYVDPSYRQSQYPFFSQPNQLPENSHIAPEQMYPSILESQAELNPNRLSFSPSAQVASSDLFSLPLATADLKPIAESLSQDPFNRFLTAPTAPFNMEGSEIGEAAFIVPDDIAFAPAPPAFVQPRKTYGLTINDGKVYRNEVRKDNGEFISSYRSADGTQRSEMGRLIKKPNGEEVMIFKGSYSFTTPEGLSFRVDYTADRNGYRATTTPVYNRPRKPRPMSRPPKHRPHKG